MMDKRRRSVFITFVLVFAYVTLVQRHRIIRSVSKVVVTKNSGKLLCWGLVNPSFSEQINVTWGAQCDVLLPITTAILDKQSLDNTFQNTEAQRNGSYNWIKVITSLWHIYEHYLEDADWIFKGNQEIFLLVGNLRKFLRNYNPNEPHFFGTVVKNGPGKKPETYVTGVAGYVLSRGALIKFIREALPYESKCLPGKVTNTSQGDDIEISSCLSNVGVQYGDTRDEKGRLRFLMEPPWTLVFPGNDQTSYLQKLAWSVKPGADGISNSLISFNSQGASMYAMDFLFNKVEKFDP